MRFMAMVDGLTFGAPGGMLDLRIPQPVLRRPNPGPTLSVGPAMDGIIRQQSSHQATEAVIATTPITDVKSGSWLQAAVGALTVTTMIAGSVFTFSQIQSMRRQAAVTPRVVSAQAAPQTTAPAKAAPALTASQLQSKIDAISTSLGAPSGIVVIDLKTGISASSNPDQVFTAASLYKLFVAESVYQKIDQGQLTLNSPAGNGQSVGQCLNNMITWSDNNCGVTLGTLVGWERQNSRLQAAGFGHTMLRASNSELTSSGDVALLLKRLYDGTLLSDASNQHFLGLLKAQQVNNRLPARLPAGTVVAHKTGDLDGLLHDAGIVYGPKGNYLVSIMSGPWSNIGAGPGAIAGASAQLYALLQQ